MIDTIYHVSFTVPKDQRDKPKIYLWEQLMAELKSKFCADLRYRKDTVQYTLKLEVSDEDGVNTVEYPYTTGCCGVILNSIDECCRCEAGDW